VHLQLLVFHGLCENHLLRVLFEKTRLIKQLLESAVPLVISSYIMVVVRAAFVKYSGFEHMTWKFEAKPLWSGIELENGGDC